MRPTKDILLLAGLLLTLAVMGSMCNKESEGNVPYAPCPCEEIPLSSLPQYSKGEAYLFKDSVPEQIRREINETSNTVCWIVFDSREDMAGITIENLIEIPYSGRVCNFPDFAKEWEIPQNGCKIHIEGTMYISCYGGTADRVLADYILTTLKRK